MFSSNKNGFSFYLMILIFFYLLLGHYHSPNCLRIFPFLRLRQKAHGGTEIGQQRMLSPPWRLILHLIFEEAVFTLLLFCIFFGLLNTVRYHQILLIQHTIQIVTKYKKIFDIIIHFFFLNFVWS